MSVLSRENFSGFFLLFFFALFFPVIIFPFASVLGYSEVPEEVAKGIMVIFLIQKLSGKKEKVIAAAVAGLLVGLSESFFSLPCIFENLGEAGFFEKIILAVPLHVLTFTFILLVSMKNKWLVLPGVIASIVFHLFYNKYFIYWAV